MVFISSHQSPKVLQPTNRPFDFIAASIATQSPPILQGGFYSVLAVRSDQLDSSPFQADAQGVSIRSLIIQQMLRQRAKLSDCQQGFDQLAFMRRGAVDQDADWETVPVGQNHDFGSFPTLGFAHASAPFFADENVPSAICSWSCNSPRCCNKCSSRDQARCQIPARVHAACRRQHVLGEGKCLGKSFQRAPLTSTHKIPSMQARVLAIGRPPLGEDVGWGNRSEISCHCSSLSWQRGSFLDPVQAVSAPTERDRNMNDLLMSVTPYEPQIKMV